MLEHRHQFGIATMCRVLKVARAGYYQWFHKPLSDRAIEDQRLLGLIQTSYAASGGVYGSRRVFLDLRELGETCGVHRVARIMRANKIKALRGYKAPRQINGWSMQPTLARKIVLDALMMAVWRRRPKQPVIVHSDQGSQYGNDDWLRFCQANKLEPGMSRRGNCWDNAVAESFFSSLKKERIKKRIYKTRDLAKADVFDYIKMFYNQTRRHSHLGSVSPEAFEQASF